MKRLMVFVLAGLLASTVFAGEAFLVTDLGSSARMIGLGNIEGFSGNANAIFENPAALYKIDRYSVSAFATKLMDEATYRNVSFGMNTEYGNWAVGYMSVDVSDVPYTGVNQVTGRFFASEYFGYGNMLAKAAYQNVLAPDVYIGASANYYKNQFGRFNTGWGLNMDVGVFWDDDPVQYSVTAKNVLRFLKSTYTDNGTEEFPLQVLTSVQYQWWDFRWLGQMKFGKPYDKPLKSVGLAYEPVWVPFIDIFGGYKEYKGINLEEIQSNLTVGVGLDLFGLAFDYAYEKSDHIEFDNNSYFSINLDF
ncbi:MAG: hypothetical protein ACI9BD_001410 [Candidatus Marinamargulisbacteria bacterium]|jgi:hypothetical protein